MTCTSPQLGLATNDFPLLRRSLRNLLIDHGFRDVETVVHTEVVTDFDPGLKPVLCDRQWPRAGPQRLSEREEFGGRSGHVLELVRDDIGGGRQLGESGLVVAVTGPTGTFGHGLVPLLQRDERIGRADLQHGAEDDDAADGVGDDNQLREHLKRMQRVFKFAPRYDEIRPLLADGLDSALAVTHLSKEEVEDEARRNREQSQRALRGPHHHPVLPPDPRGGQGHRRPAPLAGPGRARHQWQPA